MSMTLISTVTVGAGGAAGIDFGTLPQTYTDLYVVVSGRSNTSNPSFYVQYNGSGAGAYSLRRLYGTGTDAYSQSQSGLDFHRVDTNAQGPESTSNTFISASLYIPNYTSSVAKTTSIDIVNENNATAVRHSIVAALWNNTSALTSMYIAPDGNWVQYSTASIYGILKGSGGADIPVLFYDFVSGTEGWYGSNVSLSTSGGILSTNPTGNDPFIISPNISISGSTNRYVKITFKKSSAGQSATWDGSVFYTTSGHSFDGNYRMAFNEPTWDGNYKTLVFDMHNLTFGGTDWQNNTITSIRIDFSNAQSDGNFLVDSISISPTP